MKQDSARAEESSTQLKPGDIVLKKGDLDKGELGLVLELSQTPIGYKFVKVMKDDGIIKMWYAELVEVLNEN